MENYPPSATASPNADVSCPRCGRLNPPHTLLCECGQQFQPGSGVPGQSWSQTAQANQMPMPTLHWGLVLVLSLVTFGLFLPFWALRQAFWARQAEPGNNALIYYSIYVAAFVLELGLAVFQESEGLSSLLSIGGSICFLLGSFSVKSAIESYFNKRLNGLLTFLFGPIYNQYKLNEGRRGSMSILNG